MELQRNNVQALENIMRTMPQMELQTDHYFADGMYARVLFRPAGTLIVGKVHKKEHFYIVAKGCVQIGKEVLHAGTVLVSQPGTKRAVLALEDSICLTVHRTKKRNLDKIEKQMVEPDKLALFDASNKLKELT
jgi:hypothetical protein